ncbi:MAG: hypothetical protein WBI44_01820 [Syntrophaceticus sp.]
MQANTAACGMPYKSIKPYIAVLKWLRVFLFMAALTKSAVMKLLEQEFVTKTTNKYLINQ